MKKIYLVHLFFVSLTVFCNEENDFFKKVIGCALPATFCLNYYLKQDNGRYYPIMGTSKQMYLLRSNIAYNKFKKSIKSMSKEQYTEYIKEKMKAHWKNKELFEDDLEENADIGRALSPLLEQVSSVLLEEYIENNKSDFEDIIDECKRKKVIEKIKISNYYKDHEKEERLAEMKNKDKECEEGEISPHCLKKDIICLILEDISQKKVRVGNLFLLYLKCGALFCLNFFELLLYPAVLLLYFNQKSEK